MLSPIDRIANLFSPAYGHAQSSAYWFVLVLLGVGGVVGLFYGRRFFWILAGVMGFMLGRVISSWLVAPLPVVGYLVELAIATGIGLIASAAQWPFAIVVAFLGGGAVGNQLAQFLSENRLYALMLFLAFGSAAAAAMWYYYDVTLILLSSVFGLVVLSIPAMELLNGVANWIWVTAGVLILIAGALKQYYDLMGERLHPFEIPAAAMGLARRLRR